MPGEWLRDSGQEARVHSGSGGDDPTLIEKESTGLGSLGSAAPAPHPRVIRRQGVD